MAMYKLMWNLKEDIDEGINSPKVDIFEAPDEECLFQELVEDSFFDQVPEKVKDENGWAVYNSSSMEIFVRKMEPHTVGNKVSHWW